MLVLSARLWLPQGRDHLAGDRATGQSATFFVCANRRGSKSERHVDGDTRCHQRAVWSWGAEVGCGGRVQDLADAAGEFVAAVYDGLGGSGEGGCHLGICLKFGLSRRSCLCLQLAAHERAAVIEKLNTSERLVLGWLDTVCRRFHTAVRYCVVRLPFEFFDPQNHQGGDAP